MENSLKISGSIELILEDKDGNVKERQVHHNAITNAYKKLALSAIIKNTSPQFMALNQQNEGINAGYSAADGATLLSTCGIYLMNKTISVDPELSRPPYVDEYNNLGYDPSVVFYYDTVNGDLAENSMYLQKAPTRSGWSPKNTGAEYSFEFVKNTYAGTVRSIAIGRAFNIANYPGFSQRPFDKKLPTESYSGAGQLVNYLIEDTANGTIVWRSQGNTAPYNVYGYNLKTYEYVNIQNSIPCNNIVTATSGHVFGNDIWYVNARTIAATNVQITVSRIINWKTANAVTSQVISVPLNTGNAGDPAVTNNGVAGPNTDTNNNPVCVSRDGKLEIFFTSGWNTAAQKYIIRKLTINPADTTMTVNGTSSNWKGVISTYTCDFWISSWLLTNAGKCLGFFNSTNNKYYLPICGRIGSDKINNSQLANVNKQYGVILNADLEAFDRYYTASPVANQRLIWGQADEWRQYLPNIANYLSVWTGSDVMSMLNLENPITKNGDDVLRVIYSYKIN
jgi:hypothetical protein